jgi:hypothetical protein
MQNKILSYLKSLSRVRQQQQCVRCRSTMNGIMVIIVIRKRVLNIKQEDDELVYDYNNVCNLIQLEKMFACQG